MITKCKYCGYEGETHYYRRKNHCMKCNRLTEDFEQRIKENQKELERLYDEVKE